MTIQVFKNMLGRTIKRIESFDPVTQNSRSKEGDEELCFVTEDGWRFRFYHDQDCCENVRIEDICGDLKDLIGRPLLEAEQIDSQGPRIKSCGDYQWTFYRFSTNQGTVTIRWLGESNGYYSTEVTFKETPPLLQEETNTPQECFYIPKH